MANLVLTIESPTLRIRAAGVPQIVLRASSPRMIIGGGLSTIALAAASMVLRFGMAGPQGEKGDPGPRGQTGAGGALILTLPCDPAVSVGDLVALSGGEAVVASAADISKLPARGCVTAKPSSTQATIQLTGPVSGLYSGLALGAMCFVGVDGRPVSGPPVPAPGAGVFLQPVGVPLDAATLLVSPSMIISRIYGEPLEA